MEIQFAQFVSVVFINSAPETSYRPSPERKEKMTIDKNFLYITYEAKNYPTTIIPMTNVASIQLKPGK